jgi:hypothetical protein
MGQKMLVKYYKYWGEKYGERPRDREKRGEKDKGINSFTLLFFSVLVLILDSNFLAMSRWKLW